MHSIRPNTLLNPFYVCSFKIFSGILLHPHGGWSTIGVGVWGGGGRQQIVNFLV